MGFIFICSVLTLIAIVGGVYFYYQDKKEVDNYKTHGIPNKDSNTADNSSQNFTNPTFLKRLTQYQNNNISDN